MSAGASPLLGAAVAAHDALAAERVALEAGDAGALTRLAAEKRRRVRELERLLPADARALPPGVSDVLRECRTLNAANGASVAARLGRTRAALDRLARVAGLGESAGYGADGTLRRPTPKRDLGTG